MVGDDTPLSFHGDRWWFWGLVVLAALALINILVTGGLILIFDYFK